MPVGKNSPVLANLYLHYVLDLWVDAWRKKQAHGDMIIVRYADDAVLGFEHRKDAEQFLKQLRQRVLAQFEGTSISHPALPVSRWPFPLGAAHIGYTSTTMNLGDSLHVQAERNPQKTAFYCGNAEIFYERLDDSTTALAHWFLSQGLQPGDRLAVHWANSIQAVQLLYGLFKAGMIAVTVNTRLKPPEISFILSHSRARMCFSEPALAPLAREAGGDCPIFTSLPAFDDGEAHRSKLPPVDPAQPALLIYTSGTRRSLHPS